MITDNHNKTKRRKIDTTVEAYQEEHLEDEDSETVGQNFEKLENTIKLVVERLSGFEQILQAITSKIKTKLNKIETTVMFKELELQDSEGDTVTLAFPLQTIEEVSQFESDDLDSIVETFIKNLFNEHKNFSIVFKCLLKDELIVMFSDWEKMSRYRFFSEILYGTIVYAFIGEKIIFFFFRRNEGKLWGI